MTQQRLADYLGHILVAAERIQDYIADLDKPAFVLDERTQDAVVRNLEIVGEACHHIEMRHPDFVVAHPELPLSSAYQMRNAVAHGYFEVDLDVVWTTVTTDVPSLAVLVRKLLTDLN